VRLKSRGLGRKELVMDFREYDVIREGDELVIVGTIRDPVNWDFSIRMCEDDVSGFTRLLFRKPLLILLLRTIFRRKKRHHWTQDREEHLTEGRRRRIVASKKAAERLEAGQETAKPGSAPTARNVSRSAAGG
jgi:hypothetical protein